MKVKAKRRLKEAAMAVMHHDVEAKSSVWLVIIGSSGEARKR